MQQCRYTAIACRHSPHSSVSGNGKRQSSRPVERPACHPHWRYARDATQHASFSHAFSDFIKCSKGFYYARRGCAFQFYDDSRACSEHVFQYLFRRSRISCVPGDKGLEEVAYRLADGGGESGERFAARHQHPAERREQSFSKQRRPAQTRIVATTHREKFQDFRGRSRTGTIHLHVETFSQRETAP